MNHLDASKTASESQGRRGGRRDEDKKKRRITGRELDIAIKQTANLTNWRLIFFRRTHRGLLQPLKHRDAVPRAEGRGSCAREERVFSRCGKKIHRGASVFSSPSLRSVPARKNEGRRSELCAPARDATGEVELREFEIVGESLSGIEKARGAFEGARGASVTVSRRARTTPERNYT